MAHLLAHGRATPCCPCCARTPPSSSGTPQVGGRGVGGGAHAHACMQGGGLTRCAPSTGCAHTGLGAGGLGGLRGVSCTQPAPPAHNPFPRRPRGRGLQQTWGRPASVSAGSRPARHHPTLQAARMEAARTTRAGSSGACCPPTGAVQR